MLCSMPPPKRNPQKSQVSPPELTWVAQTALWGHLGLQRLQLSGVSWPVLCCSPPPGHPACLLSCWVGSWPRAWLPDPRKGLPAALWWMILKDTLAVWPHPRTVFVKANEMRCAWVGNELVWGKKFKMFKSMLRIVHCTIFYNARHSALG